MGVITAPVLGSGAMPAWMVLVANFILYLSSVDNGRLVVCNVFTSNGLCSTEPTIFVPIVV